MELQKVLEGRRSVRAYDAGKTVERELIDQIIQAAQEAPSWKNSQTGRYYAVITPEVVQEVKETCLPAFNAKSCADAPVLIVTTFETKRAGFSREGVPDNELGDHWGAYDLGLQNENLLLKAEELGLATLVMGIRNGEALRKRLHIPESQEVVAVIAVGYAQADPAKPKRKPTEEIVAYF